VFFCFFCFLSFSRSKREPATNLLLLNVDLSLLCESSRFWAFLCRGEEKIGKYYSFLPRCGKKHLAKKFFVLHGSHEQHIETSQLFQLTCSIFALLFRSGHDIRRKSGGHELFTEDEISWSCEVTTCVDTVPHVSPAPCKIEATICLDLDRICPQGSGSVRIFACMFLDHEIT
jgi:hypothetical protein